MIVMLARLRAWWADSPRARRVPGALLLPALIVSVAAPGAVIIPGWLGWLYLAMAVAGVGLAVWSMVLVLMGREAL